MTIKRTAPSCWKITLCNKLLPVNFSARIVENNRLIAITFQCGR
jgi:hypothetical protein